MENNRETMNLQQKLIAISNEMPKLLKKHYSDEVDYDFVKIDDIFELLNPAFTKYNICLQELEESEAQYSKVDASWIYTAKLTFFIVNADCPEERERVSIQLVGDHLDSPAKAKGAAWTYGFKYFFLYKFRMKQETEDPDMRGTPNDHGKAKGKVENEKPVSQETPKKVEEKGRLCHVRQENTVTQMAAKNKEEKETILPTDFLPDPEEFLKEAESAEENSEDKGNSVSENLSENMLEMEHKAETANQEEKISESTLSEDKGMEKSPSQDTIQSEKTEVKADKEAEKTEPESREVSKVEKKSASTAHKKKTNDNPGQINLLEFASQRLEKTEEQNDGNSNLENADESKDEEDIVNTSNSEQPSDTLDQEHDMKVEQEEVPFAEEKESSSENVEEEIPFEDAGEDDFFLQLQRDMENEAEKKPLTVEEARNLICPYALFEGKTFGEMLQSQEGYKQLRWFAEEYRGSDFKMKEAAQLLLENCEQKAA